MMRSRIMSLSSTYLRQVSIASGILAVDITVPSQSVMLLSTTGGKNPGETAEAFR